jgi:hypothetical protein
MNKTFYNLIAVLLIVVPTCCGLAAVGGALAYAVRGPVVAVEPTNPYIITRSAVPAPATPKTLSIPLSATQRPTQPPAPALTQAPPPLPTQTTQLPVMAQPTAQPTPSPTYTIRPTVTSSITPTQTGTRQVTVTSTQTWTPSPTWPPEPTGTTDPFGRNCCKVCTKGKACGDTCIALDKICNVPPGCACDK